MGLRDWVFQDRRFGFIESEGRRALSFTNTGAYLNRQIGKAGYDDYKNQQIWGPTDVGVDSAGNVWFADVGTSRLLKFSVNGDYLGKLGEDWTWGIDNAHFARPVSIAFDTKGNLYVSDGATAFDSGGNQRIQIYKNDGSYLNTIGQTGVAGSDNQHFKNPAWINIT